VLWRFNHYSSIIYPSARQVAIFIWEEQGNSLTVKGFDDFNLRVRYAIEKMTKTGIIEKAEKGYREVKSWPPTGLLF